METCQWQACRPALLEAGALELVPTSKCGFSFSQGPPPLPTPPHCLHHRYYGFLKAQAPGTYTLFLTSSSGAAGGRCRVNGVTLASQAYSGTVPTVTSIVSQGSTVCVCGGCTMRLLGHGISLALAGGSPSLAATVCAAECPF